MMLAIEKCYGIQLLIDKFWEENREFFNPVDRTAHAFELAVWMEFNVSFGLGGTRVSFYDRSTGWHKNIEVCDDEDPSKAARLAICQSAAYLGNLKGD